MSSRPLLVAALALAAGCADGQSFLHVTVTGDVADIDRLDVSLTNQGQLAKTSYRPSAPPLVLPFDFALTFDANRRGSVDVSVEAWSTSQLLATGETSASISPSHGTNISVALGDGALDGGTGNDLSVGLDLSGTVVDLAGADLGTVMLLGDASIESNQDTHAAGLADAGNYIAGLSGTVHSLSAHYYAGNATELLIGLYDDSGGHPHNLLTSGAVDSPVVGAWNTAAVAPVSVTAGTTYWIALLVRPSHGTTFSFDYGTGGGGGTSTEHSSASNLTAMPTVWSTGATFPGTYCSFYASQ